MIEILFCFYLAEVEMELGGDTWTSDVANGLDVKIIGSHLTP